MTCLDDFCRDVRSTLDDCSHLLKPFDGFLHQKYTCMESAIYTESTRYTILTHTHTHTDRTVNSAETGMNQFFITTLSTDVLPQMPFIMQILNGKTSFYQARCKTTLQGTLLITHYLKHFNSK